MRCPRGPDIATLLIAGVVAVLVVADVSVGGPPAPPTPPAPVERRSAPLRGDPASEPPAAARPTTPGRLAFAAFALPPPPPPMPPSTTSPMAAASPSSAATAAPSGTSQATSLVPAAQSLVDGAPAFRPTADPPVDAPTADPSSRAEAAATSGAGARGGGPPAVRTLQGSSGRSGGALLRLLELGDGPDIRLGWPARASRREALHRLLSRCHGLRLVLLAPDGRLVGVDEARALRSSGLVREIDGPLARAERQRVGELRRMRAAASARPVRLFDRDFDRRLIDGLARLVDRPLAEASSLRATLSARAGDVVIGDIVVDSVRAPGRIVIPPPRGCGR